MKRFAFAAVAAVIAAPVLAQDATGDAAKGEQAFARQCVACHVVVNDAGETLAGRNARTGPNLYGVAGRTIGTVDGFAYGDAIVALGARGDTWTEEAFMGYVQDPTGWLRTALDDAGARGKMGFKVRSEDDARDLYAYLASLAN